VQKLERTVDDGYKVVKTAKLGTKPISFVISKDGSYGFIHMSPPGAASQDKGGKLYKFDFTTMEIES